MGRLVMWNMMSLDGGTPPFKLGPRLRLKLVDTRPLSTGVLIVRYTPA